MNGSRRPDDVQCLCSVGYGCASLDTLRPFNQELENESPHRSRRNTTSRSGKLQPGRQRQSSLEVRLAQPSENEETLSGEMASAQIHVHKMSGKIFPQSNGRGLSAGNVRRAFPVPRWKQLLETTAVRGCDHSKRCANVVDGRPSLAGSARRLFLLDTAKWRNRNTRHCICVS